MAYNLTPLCHAIIKKTRVVSDLCGITLMILNINWMKT